MTQKSRTPKTSRGEHGGGGRVRNLTYVQKVLMGKGAYQATKPIQGPPGGLAGVLFGEPGKKGRRVR